EVRPGAQRGGLTKQCVNRAIGFLAALPQALSITDIRAFAQPVFGDSPSPRGLPFSEPVVPRLVRQVCRYALSQARNCDSQRGVHLSEKLFVLPGPLNTLHNFV